MDMLKKFFPFAFNVKAKDVTSMIVSIIIHLVAGLIASLALWLVGSIIGLVPVVGDIVGALLGIVGAVFDLYCLAGIVLAILLYFDMLKK